MKYLFYGVRVTCHRFGSQRLVAAGRRSRHFPYVIPFIKNNVDFG